jgi:hypothetical protein
MPSPTFASCSLKYAIPVSAIWKGTRSGQAGPVIGKPAVADVQNSQGARQFRRGIERPGPPNLPGQKDNGFGAAENFAADRGDAHFLEQLFRRQGEKGSDSGVLQSGEAEAALFEGTAEAAGKRSTDAAIAVEENPAAEGMPTFCISYF